MTDQDIFQKLVELKRQNIKVCLATIIDTTGYTPREAGAKMLVCKDSSIFYAK